MQSAWQAGEEPHCLPDDIALSCFLYLIDQYLQYLVAHYEGTLEEVIERLVYSYSVALWAAVLRKTIQVRDNRWERVKGRVLWFINDLSLMWDMGE
jgi:hypothetical protein